MLNIQGLTDSTYLTYRRTPVTNTDKTETVHAAYDTRALDILLNLIEKRYSVYVLKVAFFCLLTAPVISAANQREPIQYSRDLRPILASSSFTCHGRDPENSLVWQRISTTAAARALLNDKIDIATMHEWHFNK